MLSLSRRLTPIVAKSLLRPQQVQLNPVIARLACSDPMLKIGAWPRTQAERERAAKKYNLIPEDYEPYEEDEGWGDYPKLKNYGGFNRNNYDDFDDIEDRRYYGEPFYLHYDLYQWERIDPMADQKRKLPSWVYFSTFFGLIAFVPTVKFVFEHFKLYVNHQFKRRSKYPGGVVYAFPESDTPSHHH